jgi:hypothetical protein
MKKITKPSTVNVLLTVLHIQEQSSFMNHSKIIKIYTFLDFFQPSYKIIIHIQASSLDSDIHLS